jgi:hypothetical protein
VANAPINKTAALNALILFISVSHLDDGIVEPHHADHVPFLARGEPLGEQRCARLAEAT